MFHLYKKNSSHLKTAIFKAYKGKCMYCGIEIQPRNMQIDHIIPSHMPTDVDKEVEEYIEELKAEGFVTDSIENYLPCCPSCNRRKSNSIYSVVTLRSFFEETSKHVEEIVETIDNWESSEEYFPEQDDWKSWEKIEFLNQRNLSYAIMGYRLTDADVNACPRFSQVEKIKAQLAIVDYLVLEGETGCGKSISVFQSAYDFFQDGWTVFQYRGATETDVITIPHFEESALYIIDDAQQLSAKTIEKLKAQARPNAKILMARTISEVVKPDTLLLTNKEAVELLYASLLERKTELIPIVQSSDRTIGTRFSEIPIERRLANAREATNPWQFMYILRGGWQTMKERYQTIAPHNNCDLLAAIIASFQILKLDQAVNYDLIIKEGKNRSDSLNWDREDLKYLVNKMIVLSEDEVRIVHMESAKVIVALFIKQGDLSKRKILLDIVEKAFINKQFSSLGLVWLCNGMGSYMSFSHSKETFISELMITSALSDTETIIMPEERMNIIAFLDMVFDMPYEKNGRYYFCLHKERILDWIQNADNKNAYAYSNIINTLYNKSVECHRNFVRKINWAKLLESFLKEDKPNLYAWGELFSRITISLSKSECLAFGEMLATAIEKSVKNNTALNIDELTDFVCSILYTNPEYFYGLIEGWIPKYKKYFSENMAEAIYIFDFDFLRCVCGMSLLGGHRATSNEKRLANQVVSVIPAKELAIVISHCPPRDWHTIDPIMNLINYYDHAKAKEIATSVDINAISEIASDSWRNCYEITELCDMLYVGSHKVARDFIKNNSNKIETIYSSLAMMAPQYAIDAFDRGAKIDLLSEGWWHVGLFALRRLKKIDTAVTKKILWDNVPQIIEKLNFITALDFNYSYCLNFVKLICEIDKEIFNEIIKNIDLVKIENSWNKGAIYKGKEKIIEKRKKEFYKMIETN